MSQQGMRTGRRARSGDFSAVRKLADADVDEVESASEVSLSEAWEDERVFDALEYDQLATLMTGHFEGLARKQAREMGEEAPEESPHLELLDAVNQAIDLVAKMDPELFEEVAEHFGEQAEADEPPHRSLTDSLWWPLHMEALSDIPTYIPSTGERARVVARETIERYVELVETMREEQAEQRRRDALEEITSVVKRNRRVLSEEEIQAAVEDGLE